MTIVAGIDEAGYGPVLGPLVVACAAFEVEDSVADVSLWKLLAPTVGRRVSSEDATRIAVDDSKRVYGGGRCLSRLERGVLAFLATTGARAHTLVELLERLAPGSAPRVAALPWYGGDSMAVPAATNRSDLEIAIVALTHRLVRSGVRPRMVAIETLLVPELNRMIEHGATKADASFSRVGALIQRLREAVPDGRIIVHLDRQGGRIHYHDKLSRIVPEAVVWVVEESRATSRYLVEDGPRELDVRIAVGCDRLQLPVALASMIAKYIRELMMLLFNRFWMRHLPGIAPTAGYPADGRRFLEQIEDTVATLEVDVATLVRCR